ncbi:hypothetical protein [Falsiruegeria mediterranea]|uniref:hypothetical protein n=1 Tax=Falsiruegeria mediterranea TaxID=1280832 RepID=UPI0015F293BF|nr:hypothetical protein [Falsiruegeria mediterranea]
MSLSSLPRVLSSGVKFLLNGREKSFIVNRVEARDLARSRFGDALREAFPGATDNETARRAAKVLGRSDRQILNWLAGDSSPVIEDVYTICAILGVFRTMEILTRDQTRNDILGRIEQK